MRAGWILVIGVVACGSTVTPMGDSDAGGPDVDALREAHLEVLDGCSNHTCGWWHTYEPEEAHLRCVLEALTSGEAVAVGVGDGADGASCGSELDVHVGTSGVGYVLRVTDNVCDTEALYDELALERCSVDHEVVDACLEALDDSNGAGIALPCPRPSDWLVGCESVEAPTCP